MLSSSLRIYIQRQYYNVQFWEWRTTLRRISIFNGPRKTPWTSWKSQKQRKRNENTSTGAKKRKLALPATAIVSSGQINRVKRRERFWKIWELDRYNSDVKRDSSDEFEYRTHRDTLNWYHSCTVAPPRILLFVFFAQPLAFVSFFVFPILPYEL